MKNSSVPHPRRFSTQFLLSLALAFCCAAVTSSHAASGTWTLTGTDVWSNSADWNGGIVADGSSNTAIFNATTSGSTTIHLDTPRTIGGLTFSGTTGWFYTLDNNGNSSNILTLGGATTPAISIAKGVTATIGVQLSGTSGLSIASAAGSSASILVLTASNTYSGTTSISSGIVVINSNNNFGTGSLTMNGASAGIRFGAAVNDLRSIAFGVNGGSLDTNGFDITYSQTLSGSLNGSFGKSGLGTLILAGNNTMSGTGSVLVSAGWLEINSKSALGTVTGTLSLNNSFGIGSAGGIRFGAAFNDLPSLSIGGNGSSSAGGRLDTNGFNISYGNTITAIGGSSNVLTKDGAGTLTFTGTLSGAGAALKMIVNGGTLLVDKNAGASITAPLSTAADALTLHGGSFYLKGSSTGASSQTLGGVTVLAGGGTLTADGNGGTGTTLTVGSVLATAAGSTVNFVTNGSASILTTGTNVNDATGILGRRFVINGQDWATVTSGTITAYAGYTVGLPGSGATSTGNYSQTNSATVTTNESINTLKLNDTTTGQSLNLGTSALTLVGNALLYTGSNGYLVTGGTLSNGGEFIVQQYGSGTLAINSVITGANLTKAGTGTLVLGGSNAYTSTTFVNGGILSVSNNNQLGVVTGGQQINLYGGTLQATSTFALDNGGANKRNILLGGGGGTIDVTNGNTLTVSGTVLTDSTLNSVATAGAVSGLGSLTKTGSGTLLLTGSNTYAGVTSVQNGVLKVNGSLGNTQVIVGNSTASSLAPTLAGAGSIAGAVTISGTSAGGSAGHLAPGSGGVGTLTVGALTLSGGSILDYEFNGGPANDMTMVSAGGSLTINGGGINLYAEGTTNPWTTTGTYNLIGYTGALNGTGIGALSVLNQQSGLSYSFGTTTVSGTNYVTLSITSSGSSAASTTYTLTASAGSTNILTGGTTRITSVITNTGTGTADTLNYAGLGASSAAGGSISGTTTSGGPLAQGASGTNSGQVFTGTQSGAVVVSPVGTGSNATAGGAATAGGSTPVTVNVFDPASLSGAQSGTGTVVALTALNQSGTFRASAKVTADNGLGNNQGFTDVAVAPGTQIDPGNSVTVASFDKTNRLNGTYTATKSLGYDNVTSSGSVITGGTGNTANVGLSVTVSGQTAGAGQAFNATLFSGQKYGTTTGSTSSGYGLTSAIAGDPHSGTTATLINGTASANTTVSMSFNTVPSAGAIHDTTFRTSDILSLGGIVATGTLGPDNSILTDKYVLQLTYDPSAAGAQYIGWYDAAQSQWVNAIAGNSTGGHYDGSGEFVGSYADYLATLTGPQQADLAFQLNAFGYDVSTHTAWAVVDHNSEFAVIPEPSTWGMILSGFGMLIGVQRLRRRSIAKV